MYENIKVNAADQAMNLIGLPGNDHWNCRFHHILLDQRTALPDTQMCHILHKHHLLFRSPCQNLCDMICQRVLSKVA